MRYLFLLIAMACCQITLGQSFIFPKLALEGSSIAAIIPPNWKAIDTAYGDLNNDKQQDLVLVLEYKEAISEIRAYGDYDTEIIKEFQKPRILAVYFKNLQHKFVFGTQNNNFILRSQEGGAFGEPYQGVTISNNRLIFDFMGGSSWRWKLNYEFKYDHKDWLLVQVKKLSYDVVSGEMNDKEYNFITKKLTETIGNMFDERIKSEITEKKLNILSLRTFKTFKKPWTWEISKDEFL
jgi:hypothetical protein